MEPNFRNVMETILATNYIHSVLPKVLHTANLNTLKAKNGLLHDLYMQHECDFTLFTSFVLITILSFDVNECSRNALNLF